jgi:DNA polymerase-3 subunit delta'
MVAKKRYIILDGADRLTMPAANALLKTLEEPPKTTQFFLLAENEEAVLPTIRSRCGNVRYKRLSESFVTERLKGLTADPTKALVCARLAEGSIGRAVQYLGSNRLDLRDRVFSLLKQALNGDLSSLFLAVDEFKTELPLAVHFLDLLLYDLAMLPYDASRITNFDLAEELRLMRKQMGEMRLRTAQTNLKQVRDRASQTKINLGFHVKTCLATAFSE